jgi:hypothetical protein
MLRLVNQEPLPDFAAGVGGTCKAAENFGCMVCCEGIAAANESEQACLAVASPPQNVRRMSFQRAASRHTLMVPRMLAFSCKTQKAKRARITQGNAHT